MYKVQEQTMMLKYLSWERREGVRFLDQDLEFNELYHYGMFISFNICFNKIFKYRTSHC